MSDILAYLQAHPLLLLLVVVFVGLTVLRIVAKLACLAVLIIGGLAVGGFVVGLMRGIL